MSWATELSVDDQRRGEGRRGPTVYYISNYYYSLLLGEKRAGRVKNEKKESDIP
jgi:hypothetical protein